MHQIKRNAALTFKTFLYQVVMSLFGFMMYSSTYRIPFLLWVGQAIISVFFLFIMSYQMFQSGARACEYDRAHGLSSSPLLGFVFALVGFLPAMVLSVIGIVQPPFAANGTPTGSYAFFLINKVFLQGMYIGIFQWLAPSSHELAKEVLAQSGNSQSLYYLIFAIPGILACGIGYLVGYLQFKKDRK